MFLIPKKFNFILTLLLTICSFKLFSMEKEEELFAIETQSPKEILNEELLEAAEKGNLTGARQALEAGADINAQNAAGQPALHLAARGNHLAIVKELLLKGANVNAQNNADQSALDVALKFGSHNVIKHLVAAGSDTSRYEEERERFGAELEELYHETDYSDVEEREDFSDDEQDFDEYDSEPESIKNYDNEESQELGDVFEQQYGEMIDEFGEFMDEHELIEEGKRIFGEIFEAAKNKNYKKLIEFIAQGYTLNIQDKDRNTPLHLVIRNADAGSSNDLNMILLILEQPYAQILLRARNRDDHTPMHLAANKPDILRLLVARGFGTKKTAYER